MISILLLGNVVVLESGRVESESESGGNELFDSPRWDTGRQRGRAAGRSMMTLDDDVRVVVVVQM